MPAGARVSVFFLLTSAQLVLSAVPFDSWKLFIIARRVSSSASAYSFLKKAFSSASAPTGASSSTSSASHLERARGAALGAARRVRGGEGVRAGRRACGGITCTGFAPQAHDFRLVRHEPRSVERGGEHPNLVRDTQRARPWYVANIRRLMQATLNVRDALSYLDQVKVQFTDHPDVYNRFLDIMKDVRIRCVAHPPV